VQASSRYFEREKALHEVLLHAIVVVYMYHVFAWEMNPCSVYGAADMLRHIDIAFHKSKENLGLREQYGSFTFQ
jgi:hypothetical protein